MLYPPKEIQPYWAQVNTRGPGFGLEARSQGIILQSHACKEFQGVTLAHWASFSAHMSLAHAFQGVIQHFPTLGSPMWQRLCRHVSLSIWGPQYSEGLCSHIVPLHSGVPDAALHFAQFCIWSRFVTPRMDYGSIFPLMFGQQLMQSMRLRFVNCTFRSTPPHLVVNVIKIMVQSALMHTLVGTKLFIRHNTCHICCAIGNHRFGLFVCSVGMLLGLILVCFSRGG